MDVISSEEFKQKISNFKILFVDFFATWCGPCSVMVPVLDSISGNFKDDSEIGFYKIDIDKSKDLAESYSILSVPTFVIFKNGKEFSREMGAVRREVLENMIKAAKS
ncbi:MAG: thioredoxin [Candidatus Improbicoccus devescovinae]|nr:MAG: thioredoxin [Candidatus Improbicoccus devescovinae]